MFAKTSKGLCHHKIDYIIELQIIFQN